MTLFARQSFASKVAPLVIVGLFAAGNCLKAAAQSERRPNVIFLLADDLGYGDLGCYGCADIKTPHLDRLAADGVRMTDFYANASVCTPTRYALLTGRYQQRGGLEYAIYYGQMGVGLPRSGKTIANMLQEAGYATAISGKWHLGYDAGRTPNQQGFDHFFGLLGGNHHYFKHMDRKGVPDLFRDMQAVEMEGYSTDLITDYAIKFLRMTKDRPFFLYVPYNAPHFPFQGPEDAGKKVEPKKKSWQIGSRATYVKMVQSMDAGIGRILSELDQRGLREKTLVVFSSDNGGDVHSRNAPFAKGKGTLWEGGIRVPSIARWPGVLPAGAVSHQVAITVDWSATILSLAGAKPPQQHTLDGIDLLPILSGKKPNVHRTLFWRRVQDPVRKGVDPHRAVRDGKWKYIDKPDGTQYLHDLSADVGETKNLASQQPDRAAMLKKLLDTWESGLENTVQPNE